MNDLARRSQGVREAGAFLLAAVDDVSDVIRSWVPYDELASESLAYDYVRLEPDAFSRLWDYCTRTSSRVVADVHTHPFGARQSPSDRLHPMIGIAGHVALIVPRFAAGNPAPDDVTVNVYQGGGRWRNYSGASAAALIHLSEA